LKSAFQRRAFWAVAIALLLGIIGMAKRSADTTSSILHPPATVEARSICRADHHSDGAGLVQRYRQEIARPLTKERILLILNEFRAEFPGASDHLDLCTLTAQHISENSFEQLHLQFRVKQQAWYLAALDAALNLTAEQKRQAEERMRKRLEEDLKWQGCKAASPTIPAERIPDALVTSEHSSAPLWLSQEAYAPWRLMDLTPEQEALTVKSQGDAGWSSAVPLPEQVGNRLAIFVPGILVRTSGQPERGNFQDDSILEAVRHLHPAQLRLALLTNPVLAELLQVELDQAAQHWPSH
jgi:hypothetical protein